MNLPHKFILPILVILFSADVIPGTARALEFKAGAAGTITPTELSTVSDSGIFSADSWFISQMDLRTLYLGGYISTNAFRHGAVLNYKVQV